MRTGVSQEVGESPPLRLMASVLYRKRIRAVDVRGAAHALFEPGAIARVRAGSARRLVFRDSISHSANGTEIAHLLVEALIGVAQ